MPTINPVTVIVWEVPDACGFGIGDSSESDLQDWNCCSDMVGVKTSSVEYLISYAVQVPVVPSRPGAIQESEISLPSVPASAVKLVTEYGYEIVSRLPE